MLIINVFLNFVVVVVAVAGVVVAAAAVVRDAFVVPFVDKTSCQAEDRVRLWTVMGVTIGHDVLNLTLV